MVEHAAPIVEVETRSLVFFGLPAHADTQVESAFRQHVESRSAFRQHRRPAQRSEQHGGAESYSTGLTREKGQCRERLKPVTVGTGGLLPASGAASLGIAVPIEVLAEHHMV